jgi:hypothetical protein
MKIAEQYFQEKKPIDYLVRCGERNSPMIKQVLYNNSYLLKKNNISQNAQVKRLKMQGVKISAEGIKKYLSGVYKTCALSYLQIFALYWSISLIDMMCRDFEMEDRRLKLEFIL